MYILPAKNSAVVGSVLDVVDTVLPNENEEIQYYTQIDQPQYKLNKQVLDIVIGTRGGWQRGLEPSLDDRPC